MAAPALGRVLAGLAGLLAASLVAAQELSTEDRLRRIEESLAASQARTQLLAGEIDAADRSLGALQQDLVVAAQAIMAQHQSLMDIEAQLAGLQADEAERLGRLAGERQRVAALVGALYRLSRLPQEALIARPEAPIDTLRAARLLGAAVPAVEAEVAALRADLDALAAVRRSLEARRAEAEAVRAELDARIAGLGELLDRRTALRATSRQALAAADEQQRALAEQAADLRDLLSRIEGAQLAAADAGAVLRTLPAETQVAMAMPPPGPVVLSSTTRPMPDIATLDGVILPASGTLERRYGEADETGDPSRGLVLRPYPGAPIVSPLDGTVRFAGPFRGYGQILILDHGGGYHSMIGGLGRIDVAPGQDVLAGEPVAAADSSQDGQSGRLPIYFEFRRNGQPIDPIEGLAAAQRRG